jgi:hypothetical protein
MDDMDFIDRIDRGERVKGLLVSCLVFLVWVLLMLGLAGCATGKAPRVQHVAPVSVSGGGGEGVQSRVVVRSEGNVTRVYIHQQGGTK